MILKLQAIEKLINSELSSKIKNSTIDNEELLIEIEENNYSKGSEKISEKKKNKTTKVTKKKKIIKTKKKKESLKDNNTKDNEIDKDNKIDVQKDVDLRGGEINEDEEKTGWWS